MSFKVLRLIDPRLDLEAFQKSSGSLEPAQHAAVCELAINLYQGVEATSDSCGRHQVALKQSDSDLPVLSLSVIDLYHDCRLLLHELWRILAIRVRHLPVKLDLGFRSSIVLMVLSRHFDDVKKLRSTAYEDPTLPLTEAQQEVWDLLKKRHLTLKELCRELSPDGIPLDDSLVKQRIFRMKKNGWWIKNRRDVGYYRPDAPPDTWDVG